MVNIGFDISWWDDFINWISGIEERAIWVLNALERIGDINVTVFSQQIESKVMTIIWWNNDRVSFSNTWKEDLYRHLQCLIKELKYWKLDWVVSAWDTWTLVKSSLLLDREQTIDGRKISPALMSFFPKKDWWLTGILDLWANSGNISMSKAYIDNAYLAVEYFKKYLMKDNATLSLLNIWKESYKWPNRLQDIYLELEKIYWKDFLWNIEANELLSVESDIVVTDWFTWNIALKSIEWALKSIFWDLKGRVEDAGILQKIGAHLLRPVFWWLKKSFNPDLYAWASILWVKWLVIKTHWNSNRHSVSNSILRTYEYILSSKK